MLKSTVERGLGALALGLVLATVCLGLLAMNLSDKLEVEKGAHSQLIGQVEQQKVQAAADLARLTAERDAKQLALDNAYKQQEVTDALALQEIDRLSRVIATQPVRVRYVAAAGSGACSDNAGSEAAADPDDSTRHSSEAYGVLSARADQRFKHVAAEAEQINAAYASCRQRLMTAT